MKTKMLLFCLVITSLASAQKKFNITIGSGMGGTLGETPTVPDAGVPKGSPYTTGFLSVYYKVNDNFSSGIQFLGAGQLISTDKGSKYIAATNTKIVSGNRLPASSILLRSRYKFLTERKLNPYIDLGLGITTFTYRSITADVSRVKKTNFAISPELGFEMRRFSFAAQAILGGSTRTFEGFDSFSNTNISLRSTKALQLYFSIAYKVFQF
jgi:hypothetical protein